MWIYKQDSWITMGAGAGGASQSQAPVLRAAQNPGPPPKATPDIF